MFADFAGHTPQQLIMRMVDRQEQEFERLGLHVPDARAAALHAIDCQGLFCETDKYSRVGIPRAQSNRVRIKQEFRADPSPARAVLSAQVGDQRRISAGPPGAGWLATDARRCSPASAIAVLSRSPGRARDASSMYPPSPSAERSTSACRSRTTHRCVRLTALLERLHRHKDAAYGDAWRKRGEVIAIFANLARKYDRLLVAFDEQRPAATEPLGDTVADLCVYAGKYLTWIAEQHPAELDRAELPDPAANRIAANRGPDALRARARGRRRHGRPATRRTCARRPGPRPRGLRNARSGSDGTGQPGLAGRSTARLHSQSASCLGARRRQRDWLLACLERDDPRTSDAPAGPGRRHGPGGWPAMTDFTDQLVARTLERVLRRDARAVALLGLTPAALAVRAALARRPGGAVIGVFVGTHRGVTAACSRWASSPPRPHDLLVVGEDAGKAALLDAYRAHVGAQHPPPDAVIAGVAHLAFADPDFDELNAPALVPSYATGSPNTREHLLHA